MKPADLGQLVLLAALWGASFLFMRLGAGEFGPLPLAALRVIGASLFLLPLLCWRVGLADLRRHWHWIALVGFSNSAIPFVLFSQAALSLSAGQLAIFNASTPLFGAAIAWVWLNDRLSGSRVLGLVIGFGGVAWLVWRNLQPVEGVSGLSTGLAALACLGAAAMYGLTASLVKRLLNGVDPLAVAAGSQLSAALVLLLPAWATWPTTNPSATAWGAAALLAVVCTGMAYAIFFRLIARIGPANAISVTFLVPVFAVVWGAFFLGEQLTSTMVGACVVIVFGTSLAVGLWRLPLPGRSAD